MRRLIAIIGSAALLAAASLNGSWLYASNQHTASSQRESARANLADTQHVVYLPLANRDQGDADATPTPGPSPTPGSADPDPTAVAGEGGIAPQLASAEDQSVTLGAQGPGGEASPNFVASTNLHTSRLYYLPYRGYGVTCRADSRITTSSLVFASISETGSAAGRRFIGAAPIRIESVSPYAGGVCISLTIQWSSSLPFAIDYLVVNGNTSVR